MQYKIAEIINSGVVIDESLNIFDIIQSICSDIATVGDTKGQVNSITDDVICDYCGFKHKTEECRKLKAAKADLASGAIDKIPSKAPKVFKGRCNSCGKKGHMSSQCPTRQTNSVNGVNSNEKNGGPAEQQSQQQQSAGSEERLLCLPRFAQAEIDDLMHKIQSGKATISMVKPRCKVTARRRSGRFPPRLLRKHQHSSSLLAEGQPFGEYKGNRVDVGEESIALSLCNGIGCALFALNLVGASISRFIAVENDEIKRNICDNVNDGSNGETVADHSWASSVFDITEQMIIDLGPGRIKHMCFGPPCKDHSKLRLITPKGKPPGKRPGFSGKHGRVFRMCLLIFMWVMVHNPLCEYVVENVDFSDMPEDWAEANRVLGNHYIVSADSCSYTRRRRVYWTNIYAPSNFGQDWLPKDPDECMDAGRTVVRYMAHGKPRVFPIGASWTGPHDNPRAHTSRAIKVQDEQLEKLQELRPHEAEKLMGLPPGSTAGQGVTAKERLQGIGDGWDINVITKFYELSSLAGTRHNSQISRTIPVIICLSDEDAKMQAALVQMVLTDSAQASNCIQLYSHNEQIHMLSLLSHWYHSGEHQGAQHQGGHTQQAVMSALSSVLDSGSSRHISPEAVITDAEHTIPLTGFNNSQQWTDGSGYLPVTWKSVESDCNIRCDIDDVDILGNVVYPILSMGKLLRKGFDLFLGSLGKDMYMTAPGGAYTVKLELGNDDIIRLPHTVRKGEDSKRLPLAVNAPVNQVCRTNKTLNGDFLHQLLNHCNKEKVYQTLVHTTGFKAVRLNFSVCTWCALGKSTRAGLSNINHKLQPSPAEESNVLAIIQDSETGRSHYVLAGAATFDDSDADDSEEDEHLQQEEVQYTAAEAGRALGEQPVPRYDLSKLRPFEIMFADNKDYPFPVRAGKQVAFVLIDLKSQAKFKVDLKSKSDNGWAFQQIVAQNGVHKLDYHCHIWTDGCGSMVHVLNTAVRMGIDHAYTPPREPSLNEAEKVCNTMWAAARTHLACSKAPNSLMAEAVAYSMYMDMRIATTASRGWLTPYEMIKGVPPSLLKLQRWYTKSFVNVPPGKRKWLQQQGLPHRAKPGRLIGWHSPFSTTYKVMLSKNRLVHSSNVTFDPEDCVHISPREAAAAADIGVNLPNNSSHSPQQQQSSNGHIDSSEAASNVHNLPVDPGDYGFPQHATVDVEHCDLFKQFKAQDDIPTPDEFFEWSPGTDGDWLTHADTPKPRPRPSYKGMTVRCNFLTAIDHYCLEVNDVSIKEAHGNKFCILVDEFVQTTREIDHQAVSIACMYLALVAHKDMNWSKALESDDRESAIKALQKEKDSLQNTILVPIPVGHSEYSAAVDMAVTGRYLLDFKRIGEWKVRGVKQGFKEDRLTADGPGFVYYSHVARLVSVRMLLSRPNRGTRRIAIKDVRTAFLQSDKFPDDIVKYVCFRDPVTKVKEYYRQIGPIYGEAGAPVRWENTIAPWLVSEGYECGCNEPAAFYNDERDVLLLTFVDDILYDAEEDDICWAENQLSRRFDCKETEWLEPDMTPRDYLGMELMQSSNRLYLSMKSYIENTINLLQFDELCTSYVCPRTPMSDAIDPDSPPLSPEYRQLFMTAVGCLGWLVETGRPDVAVAHSRISQYQAQPNQSAWETVKRVFHYLYGARDWVLSCPTNEDDVNLTQWGHTEASDETPWEFFVDSDFAGNSDPANKRRSQIGIIAMCNGFPVFWSSKVSSVAFADSDIGEAHADTSSGAAEVYAAGNCTYDFLFLAHVAEEMQLEFPRPFKIQMDNSAAEKFSLGTAFKSKLKHIDCRQEWVRMLRDRNICTPVHVDTKLNLADMFTKLLPAGDFERLRSLIMHKMSE